VKSGRLEWSPVHKSEKFWHENAARLNEKNFELLKYACSLFFVIFYSNTHHFVASHLSVTTTAAAVAFNLPVWVTTECLGIQYDAIQ